MSALDSLLFISQMLLTFIAISAFLPSVLVIVRSQRERMPEQVVTTSVGLLCYTTSRLTEILKVDSLFLDGNTLHKLSVIMLVM